MIAVNHPLTPRTQVLAPLATRYAGWLKSPARATGTPPTVTSMMGDVSEEDPASVRAMPLILRVDRDQPPLRSALLEAAGSAAVALCLDERAQPGGPWHVHVQPWLTGRIRKVARRARGAQWHAVTELPGITIEQRGAQVRALLPWPVVDTPRAVTRLQVSGTDVLPDEPDPPPDGIPVLWIAPTLAMTAGKVAAQVGHAAMLLAALLAAQQRTAELDRWATDDYHCAVRTASAQQWAQLVAGEELGEQPERAWFARGVLTVRDAGFTEVEPGTVTVVAQWPRGEY